MGAYVFDQAWEGERARLANLEQWLDPGSIDAMERIGVSDGWHCLEIGGGGGSIARWLSARVGSDGAVLATDLDTRFLGAIDEPNVTVQRHDITAEDLPPATFDFAHLRLLLEHLPRRDDVLARIARALKPGGWLLVEDLDTITHIPVTENKTYEAVSEAMFSLMGSTGVDLTLGRRLSPMLREAGLEAVEAHGRIVIGSREHRPGIAMWRLTIQQLRPPAVAAGLVSDEQVDEVLAALDDPTFEVLPPSVIAAWGRKPQ